MLAHAVRPRGGRDADAVGVGDLEQVDHEALLDVAVGVLGVEVDLVEALGHGRRPVEVVALDEDHLVAADREGVADDVRRLVDLVAPGPAGVGGRAGVELVDRPAALVGVVDEGALDDRVEEAAVRRSAHRLEAAAGRDAGLLAGGQEGVLRRLAVGELDRGLQDPCRSRSRGAGTGRTPRRSRSVPSLPRTTDSMSKSAPVRRRSSVSSLTIGKRTLPAGSRSEMNRCTRICPAPPSAVSQSRPHLVEAQEEVGGVALRAEAVVGLRPERAVAVLDHGGEARDHLAGEGPGAAVAGAGLGAGRRPGGDEVRGEGGARGERRLDGPVDSGRNGLGGRERDEGQRGCRECEAEPEGCPRCEGGHGGDAGPRRPTAVAPAASRR